MICKTRRFLRALISDKRGVAALEFAFAAPVVMFMVYGVVEFGRAAYTQSALAFATEEATRFATVNYNATTDQLKQVASDRIIGINKAKIASIKVDQTLNVDDQTKLVTVSVSYNHEFLLPIFDIDGVTLNGSSKGFLVEK